MFTARGAVSNESAGKSDEALGKSIATADRNEIVFPADTVFPRRPDKTHHFLLYIGSLIEAKKKEIIQVRLLELFDKNQPSKT